MIYALKMHYVGHSIGYNRVALKRRRNYWNKTKTVLLYSDRSIEHLFICLL